MPSAWFGLNTGVSGLMANQLALDTAAHNVANANTDGYSRQRVHLVASDPYTYPSVNRSGVGQLGTGVTVATIERVRDAFLDLQIRQQTAVGGDWNTRSDELSKVESLFPEPSDSGLGAQLAKFWNAWQDLSADPTSSATRAALVEQSSTLAATINGVSGQLSSLVSGANDQVEIQVGQINDLASRIAALNQQIQRVTVGGDHPNDLMDARDQLLDQLNAIIPTTVQSAPDGTVSVLIGGTDLVSAIRARTMSTQLDAAGNLVPTWDSGAPVALGQGSLSALVGLRDSQLVDYQKQLNELAKTVADEVNALHTSATYPDGTAGKPFFTMTAGQEAASLAVNADIVADPRLVATGGGLPGDGSIAGQIADLRNAKMFTSSTQTAADFYAGLVGTIGSDSRQAAEMASNQQLVVDHLTQRRESISGVSLDEEATDMIRFQRGYQAAARVITTMDDMLDTLINKTGLVGR
jgi:flagellar hook-associated protein 1 FlgK